MQKQLSFHSTKAFKKAFADHKPRHEHGHGVRSGKRKLARPFDSKRCMHLTLRSSKARGTWSFLRAKTEKNIKGLIYTHAAKANVKIYRYANGGNHLHLLVKASSRRGFQKFLRTVTGLIPRLVTGAKKGSSLQGQKAKFWDGLAYSKLVSWGRQFKDTTNYIFMNELEAYGIIPPRPEARGHSKINYHEIFEG
jgi:REP element-mobilizing transposase RayT